MNSSTGKPPTTSSAIFPWRSLKAKVTIFILAFFLIGIWSLAFFVSRMLYEDMHSVLGAQQFSMVSVIAADINAEFDDRLRTLEKVAARITPAILGNAAAMQKFIEERIALATLFNSGIMVTRRDGTVIADTMKSSGRIGVNYRDREYIVEALNGKSNIGKPVMGKKMKIPGLPLTVPIRDAQGGVIGAMMGGVNLGMPNFLDRITNTRYGNTGGYLLAAPQHNLFVIASDKSRIMQPLPAPGINKMHDRYMKGFEGFGIAVNSRGIEELSAAKQIPAAGWFVVAVLPTREAFAPIHAMQKRMILATIFLTLLAGGLTWWMLRRQLAPLFASIKTLTALTDTNELPHLLPINRQDEIGELIGSFNHLLQTLGQREEALRESEERYRMIFSNSPLGIMHFDADGIIVDFNDKFARIMGGPREKIIGFNMLEKLKDQAMLAAVRDALDGRLGYYEGDYVSITAGKTTPMRAIYQKITTKNGKFLGAVGLFEDITERKESEAEKEKLQNQLLQAQKLEAIGQLAGGVAHDFNNMLGVILGHAEIALDRIGSSDPLHADLLEIRNAAERSAALTRQMLAFARKQTIAPKVLDLNETVAGMLKMLERLIGEDINLLWLPGADLWQVKVDPFQIDQILANLCVNARDAIAGVGKIIIETGNINFEEDDCPDHVGFVPGEYVLLTVNDNGCGMDKETLNKIYEPFFTTKDTGQGTGLGLATVYGIVKQNSGFISVYSEPGLGTTFKIYLPRYTTVAEKATKESPQESLRRGQETILLVEDEPALLDLSKIILDGQGYQVLAADTPGEAIRLAEEYAGEIHLLMTDVVMPDMNGKDLAKRISSLYPKMKRLFMSGYTADVIAHNGILDEGVYFIQKPFSRKDLTAKVRAVLDQT